MVTNSDIPLTPEELVGDMIGQLKRAGREQTARYFEGEAKKTFDGYVCIKKEVNNHITKALANTVSGAGMYVNGYLHGLEEGRKRE